MAIAYDKYKNMNTKEKSQYILDVVNNFKSDIMGLMPIEGDKIFTFNKYVIKDEETEK